MDQPDVIDSLKNNLIKKFPELRIVGSFCPPFKELSEKEEDNLTKDVNRCKPDFFWVGLSTPKQERFMSKYIEKLNCGIMIGVGAAFDIHAGFQKDAPNWMKEVGLQWLYRLLQEPKRLWRRYMKIVPKFILLASLQCLGLKKFKIES